MLCIDANLSSLILLIIIFLDNLRFQDGGIKHVENTFCLFHAETDEVIEVINTLDNTDAITTL